MTFGKAFLSSALLLSASLPCLASTHARRGPTSPKLLRGSHLWRIVRIWFHAEIKDYSAQEKRANRPSFISVRTANASTLFVRPNGKNMVFHILTRHREIPRSRQRAALQPHPQPI